MTDDAYTQMCKDLNACVKELYGPDGRVKVEPDRHIELRGRVGELTAQIRKVQMEGGQ